ncbi:hypothetical protein, partial [Streptomyces sp. NPDC048720]|uniref:hypothetical protein n=1 Tax=Streptomyces sp. NPDC048720 TaxID=3365588 RepID=UPI003716DC31
MKAATGPLSHITAQNDPGNLAELIERQAAAQDAQVQQKMASGLFGGATDPFTALQDQLFNQVNSIQVAPTPLDELRRLATQQVSAQYDPQISALNNEMGRHTKRADHSAQTARKMYGALAQDYLSQLPELTAQYKAEDDQTNARYDQAQQDQQAEYNKNAHAQDAVLKQLGIQAAAPDASQQAKDDQAYFNQQSELQQQSAMDQLNSQQNAEMDYTRNLGSNARM